MRHMRSIRIFACGSFIASLLLQSQTSGLVRSDSATKPVFEVLSFKRTGALVPGRLPRGYPTELLKVGRVSCDEELGVLIREAWGLRRSQYSAPSWVETEFYDMEARFPAGSSRATLDLMIQSALEERLGLVFHTETRVVPIYALTVAKGGVKLALAGTSKPVGQNRIQLGGYHADAITLDFLAGGFLSHNLDRPVVDQTGLKEAYAVDLDWAEHADGGRGPSGLDFFSVSDALRRVGLSLQAQKQAQRFVVIDRLDKEPIAN